MKQIYDNPLPLIAIYRAAESIPGCFPSTVHMILQSAPQSLLSLPVCSTPSLYSSMHRCMLKSTYASYDWSRACALFIYGVRNQSICRVQLHAQLQKGKQAAYILNLNWHCSSLGRLFCRHCIIEVKLIQGV